MTTTGYSYKVIFAFPSGVTSAIFAAESPPGYVDLSCAVSALSMSTVNAQA